MSTMHYFLKFHQRDLFIEKKNIDRDFNMSTTYDEKNTINLNLTTVRTDIYDEYFKYNANKTKYDTH